MTNISSEWIQGITKEDRAGFKEVLFNNTSNLVLTRLREIIKQRGDNLDNIKLGTYDDSSWSHKQAHINGARQTLKEIEDLLSFTEETV
jgi:acetolactate synthase small subunit